MSDLEDFFDGTEIEHPAPIQIYPGQTITDVNKFVTGHLLFLRGQWGNKRFRVYYLRLVYLMEILKAKK